MKIYFTAFTLNTMSILKLMWLPLFFTVFIFPAYRWWKILRKHKALDLKMCSTAVIVVCMFVDLQSDQIVKCIGKSENQNQTATIKVPHLYFF